MRLFCFLFISIFSITCLFAQNPHVPNTGSYVIPYPQPADITKSSFNIRPTPSIPNHNNNTFEQNLQKSQQQIEQYNKEEQQRKQAEYQRLLMEEYYNSKSAAISYELPSYSSYPGTQTFKQAFGEINGMLQGKTPLDLKRSVYLTEYAFLGDLNSYDEFNALITEIGKLLKEEMLKKGYDTTSNLAKNWIIFQFFTDTLQLGNKIHFPMEYDFEDYKGKQDFTKMFVSKLLKYNTGQCHSLPLLYLLLANEIGAKAYIAYSPSHSYIRFQDDAGLWYNVELTNHHITSDAWVLESGYIKAEAIKNDLYLRPLTDQELIADRLFDLSKGYTRKFGFDEFVIQCVDTNLTYHPTSIFAWLMKSDYYTVLFEYILHQTGRPHPDILKQQYPQGWAIYQQRNSIYDQVDNMGYEDMPDEVYQAWLKSVEKEKEKRENEKLMKQINIQLKKH